MRRVFFFILFYFLVSFHGFGAKNIAISYFDNTSGTPELAPLSKGIADMLITDLTGVSGVNIVEREKLEELIGEIKLNESKYFDKKTAQKLGKGLGAEAVLTGAYLVMENTLRIDARLVNVESGSILMAKEVTGPKKDFFKLHGDLVELLRQGLKLSDLNPDLKHDEEVHLDAVLNYSRAVEHRDNGLGEEAEAILSQTLEQYPEFIFAQQELDDLKEWLAKLEKKRRKLLMAEVEKMLSDLDTASEQFPVQVTQIWGKLSANFEYTKILWFDQQLKKMGIEEDRKVYASADYTLGEMMEMYDCTALNSLRQYEKLVPKAKKFLEKYPTSMYFTSIKMQLQGAIRELEKREKGKAKAEKEIEEVDTSFYKGKSRQMQYANIYRQHHQYKEEIALRWKILQEFDLQKEKAELQHYLLYNAYNNLGKFDKGREIAMAMEKKFPEGEFTATMQQIGQTLPK